MSDLKEIFSILPYKITKRINKTGEGRSGLEIYKRRNRRNYRVIIQYITWNNLKNNDSKILDEFEEGYAVIISPDEYFGNNYPNPAKNLNKDFILGKTGFIYYSTVSELNKYPPIHKNEVIELKTQVSNSREISWVGEVVFNVKNSITQRISAICSDKTSNSKNGIKEYIKENYKDLADEKIPEQCGLGNYDYDYASKRMIEDVKIQMTYLLINSISKTGKSFKEYIIENYGSIRSDNNRDKEFIRLIESNKFSDDFDVSFNKFQKAAAKRQLLNYTELSQIGAWGIENNQPVCPLCGKVVNVEEFFEEITQQEGRRVSDNTQRSIVLMHIKALKPGELNHSVYNLGWGHNFCNSVQGDKDVEETINALEKIVKDYKERRIKWAKLKK